MKHLFTRLSLALLAFSVLWGMSVRADVEFELINITESLLLGGAASYLTEALSTSRNSLKIFMRITNISLPGKIRHRQSR